MTVKKLISRKAGRAAMRKSALKKVYQVNVMFDPGLKRWLADSPDIDGLHLETSSYDELIEVLEDVVPDLVKLGKGETTTAIPFHISHSQVFLTGKSPS